MKVGERIKKIRKEKNISQSELARKMNISQAALSQLESKETLKFITIEKVANALDVPISFIGYGIEENNNVIYIIDNLIKICNLKNLKLDDVLSDSHLPQKEKDEILSTGKCKIKYLFDISHALNIPSKFLTDFSADEITDEIIQGKTSLYQKRIIEEYGQIIISDENNIKMIGLFNQLNDIGQEKAIDQVEMLTKIEEYKK